MFVTSTETHTITECACCKKLLFVKATRRKGLDEIGEKIDRHLARHRRCRRWHSRLPTFYDLHGIAPDMTGNLSSEAFVRIVREGGDPWSEENQAVS